MTKRDRALELRDLALAVLRARGACHPVLVNDGSIPALTFDDDGLSIFRTTPFQRLLQPTGVLKYLAALHGLDPPESLPYGLDVWRDGKKKIENFTVGCRGGCRGFLQSRRLGARARTSRCSSRDGRHIQSQPVSMIPAGSHSRHGLELREVQWVTPDGRNTGSADPT
jgi:hypothetical protein